MHIFEKTGVRDRFELAVHGRRLLGAEHAEEMTRAEETDPAPKTPFDGRAFLAPAGRALKYQPRSGEYKYPSESMTPPQVLTGRAPAGAQHRIGPDRALGPDPDPFALRHVLSGDPGVAVHELWRGGLAGTAAGCDAGWHIRTGEYILDHHAVPHQDLYSFSKPGHPGMPGSGAPTYCSAGCIDGRAKRRGAVYRRAAAGCLPPL